MRRFAPELIFSLLAVAAITAWYVHTAQNDEVPAPGGLIGHGMGIVGFVMMLGAETLYTLRKRVRGLSVGATSVWLQAHIFLGIVGPFLVVLHSAGKVQGLAGVVTILTVVMVLSGFVGRYIYTAAPRTLDGVEVEANELETMFASTDGQLRALASKAGQTALPAIALETPPQGWIVVVLRPILRWRYGRRVHAVVKKMKGVDRKSAREIERLFLERYHLLLQIYSLAAARRLLAVWHILHVPLGGVLFALAFIHVGAALYYATFRK
jgi:hypothetical protein